ncbi:MAG: precorrin-2 C(20)-methyltransferase [Chloroflexi bacterium]|nr:precorrin-2 C(20)-methyltransferase [Chloroflexota bacterium]
MSHDSQPRLGRLFGVGVGPGDPELLTIKAARILREVPVVVVPRKTSRDESYAYSIVANIVDHSRQEVLPLVFPMKKDLGELRLHWRQACDAIYLRLLEGKDCAFLTEGDPLLYGTFIYVYHMLRDQRPQIDVEIVPGVSSINAAAARAALPLVSGDERLAVLPASYEGGKLREALQKFDTVVLVKLRDVFDEVLNLLEEMQLVNNAVYVKKCTATDEEIVRDIRTLRGQRLDYLSLLIVRKPK